MVCRWRKKRSFISVFLSGWRIFRGRFCDVFFTFLCHRPRATRARFSLRGTASFKMNRCVEGEKCIVSSGYRRETEA